MSIGKVFSKSNVVKYIVKGSGLAALGVVGYDAHIIGKMQADSYAKRKDADACMKTQNNTQLLSSPSMTTAGMKDKVNHWELDGNFRHFVNSTVGYFKGFGKMLINGVVPFGLGLGALFGKGLVGKGSAIGLGIYAGIKFFKDVLGYGHYNDLNRKF